MDKINKWTNYIGYKIGEKRYNIYKGNPRGIKRGKVVVKN
jgi:hypothetical protein